MLVELLVDLNNHKKGVKIELDSQFANKMISNGYAKEIQKEKKETIVSKELNQTIIPEKPKKRGNPNFGKKK